MRKVISWCLAIILTFSSVMLSGCEVRVEGVPLEGGQVFSDVSDAFEVKKVDEVSKIVTENIFQGEETREGYIFSAKYVWGNGSRS